MWLGINCLITLWMCNLELSREPSNRFSFSVWKQCRPMHLYFILRTCLISLLIYNAINKGIIRSCFLIECLIMDEAEGSSTGVSDFVVFAGRRPHQRNWPHLLEDYFSGSAVLIRAAGVKLRNVSARNVEVQHHQLLDSTESSPHWAEIEVPSVNVHLDLAVT